MPLPLPPSGVPESDWAGLVALCAAKLPGMSGREKDYYLAWDKVTWAGMLPGESAGRIAARAMAEAIRAERLKAGKP